MSTIRSVRVIEFAWPTDAHSNDPAEWESKNHAEMLY